MCVTKQVIQHLIFMLYHIMIVSNSSHMELNSILAFTFAYYLVLIYCGCPSYSITLIYYFKKILKRIGNLKFLIWEVLSELSLAIFFGLTLHEWGIFSRF